MAMRMKARFLELGGILREGMEAEQILLDTKKGCESSAASRKSKKAATGKIK